MKELWVEIDESISPNAKIDLFRLAAEVCDVILIEKRDVDSGREIKARIASRSVGYDIRVVDSFDEDIIKKLKNSGIGIAVRIRIERVDDEKKAVIAADLLTDYIILECPNWKTIPLENLIAKTRGKTKLLAEVTSSEDARLALETLELGADGVVLKTANCDDLQQTAKIIAKENSEIPLVSVKVVEIKPIGVGSRACVDTCEMLKPGEGILVGCQSCGLFLLEAEVHENPFVEVRPFRINAGPVSLYALTSLKGTNYLSELKAGHEVLVVDARGNTRVVRVGRIKIELRPLILVEAELKERRIKIIVQNAETVRFITYGGSKSIAELKIGDEVLAHVIDGGRHFGTLVTEESVFER